jgi:hypothetical protein
LSGSSRQDQPAPLGARPAVRDHALPNALQREDEQLALIMEATRPACWPQRTSAPDTEWCAERGDVAVRTFPGTTSLSRWLLRARDGGGGMRTVTADVDLCVT